MNIDGCPCTARHSTLSMEFVARAKRSLSHPRKFLFLDRDGVINHDRPGFVKAVDEFEYIPGSLDALARAFQSGWIIHVCTIQPAISEGTLSVEQLDEIHEHLRKTTEQAGALIAEIYYCPHLFEDRCWYRKRNPGQLFDINYQYAMTDEERNNAWIVGDNLRDLYAGHTFGCKVALVKTGFGAQLIASKGVPEFAYVFDDLLDFVNHLMGVQQSIFSTRSDYE